MPGLITSHLYTVGNGTSDMLSSDGGTMQLVLLMVCHHELTFRNIPGQRFHRACRSRDRFFYKPSFSQF